MVLHLCYIDGKNFWAQTHIRLGLGPKTTIKLRGMHVIQLPENYAVLSPILHVIPLQLLAYHTAIAKGTDVDKPRNLAKSVTTE